MVIPDPSISHFAFNVCQKYLKTVLRKIRGKFSFEREIQIFRGKFRFEREIQIFRGKFRFEREIQIF